jgi:hypothetical protein
VFEKAQRKVAECTFFLYQLRETQDSDATEFFFNALLNAGKNVVNALQAQVNSCERTCLPCEQAKKKAKQVCTNHIKAWKRTRGGFHPTLFDVLQDSRDIETHADRSAMRYLPQTEERRQRWAVPSDSQYRPIFAFYRAINVLSDDVTVPTTIYHLQVDPAVSAKKSVQARFKQFDKSKPKSTAELATTYADLLASLVAYFITHYRPPAPA